MVTAVFLSLGYVVFCGLYSQEKMLVGNMFQRIRFLLTRVYICHEVIVYIVTLLNAAPG